METYAVSANPKTFSSNRTNDAWDKQEAQLIVAEDRIKALEASIYIFEAEWVTGGYHDPQHFWERCFPILSKLVRPEMTLAEATDFLSRPYPGKYLYYKESEQEE